MRDKLYSNKDFNTIKDRLNKEFKRRSTYNWYNPLSEPTIGSDKTPPRVSGVLGFDAKPINPPLTDGSYTINNPSNMSFSPSRNITYESVGSNPAGVDSNVYPTTSAAAWTVDEAKNYLLGLAKMKDIELFYGLDEEPGLAFRDPNKLEERITEMENELLNVKTDEEFPSGELDGEEIDADMGTLGPTNFFDDYGIPVGQSIPEGEESKFGIKNPGYTPLSRRDQINQENDRSHTTIVISAGGNNISGNDFNPRNPKAGEAYPGRAIYTGVNTTSCAGACTGLCYQTCDNQCSESCSTTCWSQCGNACTSSCGMKCGSQCVNSCEMSCSSGCKDNAGHSCLNSGTKAMKFITKGGKDGVKPSITIETETYSCSGCAYSCQFYPNRKTTCWDAGCMTQCFTSCNTGCATSCVGACIGEDGYTGGSGCSDKCTMNCVNICSASCETLCVHSCFTGCDTDCSDNCVYTCATNCGESCSTGCTNTCTGCSHECTGNCADAADSRQCAGCSSQGGCSSECMFGCNNNCLSAGCRGVCASETGGGCDANCRNSCSSSSCTSLCENQCTDQCTTCVNTCGWQCGPCSSTCSSSCSQECNIQCSQNCANSCEESCFSSCTEGCNGCTNLCYSCTGMCVGVCSFKCEVTCSHCANKCSHWCDTSCGKQCFSNCDNECVTGCSASCSGYVTGRETEKESFKIIKEDD